MYGVPQGSVLGPLLFNIFINDFVLAIQSSQVCNFADDNTVFACGKNVEEVIACLEFDIENAISWYRENNMVANPDKFQMMFIGLKESKRYCHDINGNIIVNTDTVKLLGVTIDSKLNFREHVTHICKKMNQKTGAFSRIARYLDVDKAKILYHAFILSNFNYCPLIWMFCGKAANKSINRLHKRALRVLYRDYDASFEDLLRRSGELTIHCKNLQKLMLEIYKSINAACPSFMSEFFIPKDIQYDLRTNNLLQLPKNNTVAYGNNSLSFRGSILWNTLPDTIKAAQNTKQFKNMIKNWKGDSCSCNICR